MLALLGPGGLRQPAQRAWLAGLKAEATRRGLDQRDFDQLYRIKPEWEAAHPRPRATLAQVADHIDHVRPVAGVDTSASAATLTARPTSASAFAARLPGPPRGRPHRAHCPGAAKL